MRYPSNPDTARHALWAGALYVLIIAAGLTGEFAVRQALVVPGDAAATAAQIRGAETLFRAGFALDAVMVSADVALAVLLFSIFRPVNPLLAGLATAFRLIQAAILGANLLLHLAALRLALSSVANDAAILTLMQIQADGYDLGLIFFGLNSLAMAALLWQAGPRILGGLMAAAGVVYLTGSFVRFLAPGLHSYVEPAYAITILAELAFAIWLLSRPRTAALPV